MAPFGGYNVLVTDNKIPHKEGQYLMSYTTTSVIRCQLDILTDRSPTGKERPWRDHKLHNQYLAMAYDDIDPAKAVRLRDCATSLSFDVALDGGKRLATANFCRVRLCPMCQWRRSLKTFGQAIDVLRELGDKWRYVFLTLTLRNVSGGELDTTVTHMMQSWQRLSQTKDYKAAVHGHMRTLEITHNLADNTYHPHMHALLAVRPSYYSGQRYMSQARWTELWQRSARLDYTPIVHVESCKGTQPHQIAETAKYAVKSGDYIIPDDWQLTVDTVALLDKVLANRRFVAWGGIMADVRRQLRLDDVDDGDLIHVEPDQDKPDKAHRVYYSWASGYNQYVQDV